MATKLVELIEKVNADDLPTNEFTIEDKDPMVILGKLNEVIANLKTLNSTINSSDNKANEALQKAIQAVADATQALSVANGIDSKATQALANAIEAVSTANTALSASNTALSTANTAISTANTALSSANDAVETAENALGTANSAETKADTAIATANGAKTTAEGIDNKATTALSNSQTAVSTANTADTKATQALATANSADATANTANDTANTALTNSSNALTTSNEANTKATTALATANTASTTANTANDTANGADTKANTAITTANEAKATAEEALDQVVAGLGTKVYRDSQLLSTLDIKPIEDDIANNATAINNEATTRTNAVNALDNAKVDKVAGKQLSTEDFTTAEKNKLAGLNNYDDTQVQANITYLLNGKTDLDNNKADKDLSNVSYPPAMYGSSTTGAGDVVKEVYISKDGKTWYRKWKSGWKECGLIGITNTQNGIKALPLSFSSKNYTVFATYNYTNSSNTPRFCNLYAEAYSTTSIRTGDFGGLTFNIYCCGY